MWGSDVYVEQKRGGRKWEGIPKWLHEFGDGVYVANVADILGHILGDP